MNVYIKWIRYFKAKFANNPEFAISAHCVFINSYTDIRLLSIQSFILFEGATVFTDRKI